MERWILRLSQGRDPSCGGGGVVSRLPKNRAEINSRSAVGNHARTLPPGGDSEAASSA